MKTSDRDDVGFGKPPKRTQFKKGTSGNRAGRPRGSKNFRQSIDSELTQIVEIIQNGRKIRVSGRTAIAKRLVSMALSGNLRAIKIILEIDPPLREQVLTEFTLNIGKVRPPWERENEQVG